MADADEKPVIIVEDDLSMSQALERILRLGGRTSVTYTSAEALLASNGMEAASCLILDVQLPRLGGFELYERLSQRGFVPPVIFITAFDDPDVRAKANAAGAVAFLAKPFSGRTLLETIDRALKAP